MKPGSQAQTALGNRFRQFHSLFFAATSVHVRPCGELAHTVLLSDEHRKECLAALVVLQFLELRLLSLGHRACDAMALPLVLAHIHARAWDFLRNV